MNTVGRIIAVMNYMISANHSVGVTDVARQLGLGKATVYRILTELESNNWVIQNTETKDYKISTGILEIGLSLLNKFDIQAVSLPHLSKLRDTTGETTLLSIRINLERLFIVELPSKYELSPVVSS